MAAFKNVNRQRQAAATSSRSRSAPIGGINTRDPEDDMPELDAIRLINWIPDSGKLVTRPGQSSHGTGVGSGDVETLVVWNGPASSKLVAAGGGELYDASSAGAASGISSSAGYGSNQWQTTNFNGRIFGVNGEDAPWDYDGTSLTSTSWSGSGLTITDLIGVTAFNERLYFVEKDSANFWYGSTGGVTGTLTKFSLGQIVERGGHLVAIGTWSRDGGFGLDDLIVFVMSSGEMLVYQGTDPGSLGSFWKQGSYMAAEPIGRRCVTKVGGDLAVITKAGVLPVSLIMQGWTSDAINRKTQWGKYARGIRDAAALYSGNWGWQASEVFPNGRIYFNIPVVAASTYYQFVLNSMTGSWGEMHGVEARCRAVYNSEIYFGGTGGVVWKHAGTTDDGSAINFNGKGAFTYLGSRERRKQFTAVRPVIRAAGTVNASVGLDVDFSDISLPANMESFTGDSTGSLWDADLWDVGVWADEPDTVADWVSAGGEGRNCAVRFEGSASVEIEWFSTDYMAKIGGFI